MKYEIINPSDKAFIETDEFDVAAVACILIGRGQYAFEPDADGAPCVPIFLFGGAEEWFEKNFGGRKISAVFDDVKREKLSALVACLRSAKLASGRSSMNDFTGYAHKLADKLESDSAPDPGRPAQVVFVSSALDGAKETK